jgi:hypothetical protein
MELTFSIFFEIFHVYGLVVTGLSDRGTHYWSILRPDDSSLDNSSLGYFFARKILCRIILRSKKSLEAENFPAKNHRSEELSGEELSGEKFS